MKKTNNKSDNFAWTENKIKSLDSKIKSKQQELRKDLPKKPSIDLSLASKISADLVGGIVAGLIIGIYFDKLLESKPIFVIICLIFGIAAGIKNVIKHLGS
ncbi:MAG: AtpZ/AtpI family protein [Rickettsiaceae bacterium]|nr:AtpZ/AtpI family protein [Rickettsiaceae bacterium]